jgi:hypothetical protein
MVIGSGMLRRAVLRHIVKVDFSLQNSPVLQHRQHRKLPGGKTFGWCACCNWT